MFIRSKGSSPNQTRYARLWATVPMPVQVYCVSESGRTGCIF